MTPGRIYAACLAITLGGIVALYVSERTRNPYSPAPSADRDERDGA